MLIKMALLLLSLINGIYAPFENTSFYSTAPLCRRMNFKLLLNQGASETICVIYNEGTKKISFLKNHSNEKAFELYCNFSYRVFTKYFSPDYNLLVVSNLEHIPIQKIITKVAERIKQS